MYQRILLTTDASDLADAAVPHALSLAAPAGAEVVVLQVVDSVGQVLAQSTPAGWMGGGGQIAVEEAEQAVRAERQAAEEHLAAVQSQLAAGGVTRVRTLIGEGVPGQAIIAAVESERPDVVVMATHGRSGLGRAVLGSVADHVVRHAHCPVLLVRPPQD